MSGSSGPRIHFLSSPKVHQSPCSRLTGVQSLYFSCYLASLLLAWSPLKLLNYLVPLVVTGLLVFRAPTRLGVGRIALFALLFYSEFVIHFFMGGRFIVGSALLSLVTWSSFFVLLAVPARLLANRALFDKMLAASIGVAVFEAIVGVLQAIWGFYQTGTFDLGNGDFVTGTIHVGPGKEGGIGNPAFAMQMGVVLLFALWVRPGRRTWPVGLIGMAFLLASVMHVILAAVVAGFGVWSLRWRRRPITKSGVKIGAAVAVILITSFVALRQNYSEIGSLARISERGENPKYTLVKELFGTAATRYPYFPFIGFGPGQFSSQAGLIGTGMYFGGILHPDKIPGLPFGVSGPSQVLLLPLWRQSAGAQYGESSSYHPYCSWLSVLSELGWPGVAAMCAFIVLAEYRLLTADGPERIRLAAASAIIMISIASVQQNYLEVPQVLFPSLLLIYAAYAFAVAGGVRSVGLGAMRSPTGALPDGGGDDGRRGILTWARSGQSQ